MKCPSRIYKWCCPSCDNEDEFEWVGDTHLECSECNRIGVEESFVECPDELPEEFFKNTKRGPVIK